MVTIYDVAARANVSPATVSRVMNGIKVSEPQAEQVRRAAKELNFVPNRAARRLRRRKSEIIALLIPDIANPFFTEVTRGAEDVANQNGLSVLLCNSDDMADKEAKYLRILLSEGVAGIIIVPSGRATDLSDVVERGVPVVCLDRTVSGVDVDSVVVDSVPGARRAVSGLYAAGRRLVGCVTGPRGVETAVARAQGWLEVFRDRHPELDPQPYLRHTSYSVDGGRAAAEALLNQGDPPDALFVANNAMAVGVLQYLFSAEMSTQEVGVTVFGELPFVTYQPRGVTVMSLPARELGRVAMELLASRIHGEAGPGRHEVIPVHVGGDQDGLAPVEAWRGAH